jgi:hypothetical protein
MQQAIRIESRRADPTLAHKPLYRDQALADGINGEEQTFQSDGAEQGRTFGRNETWSHDFIAVQTQSCFGDGPDISLSTRDHDALRADGLQLKLLGQRSWHHGERSLSVNKKLAFFNMPCRTRQMGLYVEQSHIESLLKNRAIVAQPTNNATTLISVKKVAQPANPSVEQTTKFELVINLKTAQALHLTIPQSVLYRADKVIR